MTQADGSQPVVITSIELISNIKPLARRVWFETDGAELGFALGSLPRWRQNYATGNDYGKGARPLGAGYEIATRCGDSRHVTQMFISVKAAAGGSDVQRFRVDFEVGGQTRTVTVPWTMVLCGDRERQDC